MAKGCRRRSEIVLKTTGPPVLLVAMPWAKLERPSIQLGILLAVLRNAGIDAETRSYYLKFMEYLAKRTTSRPEAEQLTVDDYTEVANRSLVGDWIFAVPPFCKSNQNQDEYFCHLRHRGFSEDLLTKIGLMRACVPDFVDQCAREILASNPKIVGFTTSFSQSVASLVLSRTLKAKNPSLKIVFGGANCDGCMGEELHRAFPWIDVVVRGEAERVLPRLFSTLLAGEYVEPQPGVCYRNGSTINVVDLESKKQFPIDQVPAPIYDEYFDRLKKCSFSSELLHRVSIPFETSRGCWWGAKSQCTFCGLNGSAMAFRSKTPRLAFEELKFLASRHGRLEFTAVDNIIDMKYLREFLPLVTASEFDFRLFYETKANLTREHLRTMWNAGVRQIQPGIESLSTEILNLMRKGVTALQNLRLLKWCAEIGIQVSWNLIYGFPGEPSSEYDRMANLVKSLTHLPSPDFIRLAIERFSPYQERPEEYGLAITRPTQDYDFIYRGTGLDLCKFAYSFDYRYLNDSAPEGYTEKLKQEITKWKNQVIPASLSFARGPGFSIIRDRRPELGPCDYRLGDVESQIYISCEEGTTVRRIGELLKGQNLQVASNDIEEFLLQLLDSGLVYEEQGKFLSLATRMRRRIEEPDIGSPRSYSDDNGMVRLSQVSWAQLSVR